MNKGKSIFYLQYYFVIQSTLKSLREILVGKAFSLFSELYRWIKPRPSWNLSRKKLLSYPVNTLGYHLACFLIANDLNPQEGYEDHDIYHVITNCHVDTASEIAMQYWLYGNGKRSPFVLLAMTAAILYPENWRQFFNHHKAGAGSPCILGYATPSHLNTPIKFLHNLIQIR